MWIEVEPETVGHFKLEIQPRQQAICNEWNRHFENAATGWWNNNNNPNTAKQINWNRITTIR